MLAQVMPVGRYYCFPPSRMVGVVVSFLEQCGAGLEVTIVAPLAPLLWMSAVPKGGVRAFVELANGAVCCRDGSAAPHRYGAWLCRFS